MPDVSAMVRFTSLREADVMELAQRAENFLAGHRWCLSLTERYLAWALAPQIGVFFFRLIPAGASVDDELWVIVGDVPPTYIVCDNASTWQEAFSTYGVEMRKWVEAVRKGQSIAEIIPVNVAPTIEYADMLESRIASIWKLFLDVPEETLPAIKY